MGKINAKKPKQTTRDRCLKTINYYCSKNFGIWVECTDCEKWRRTLQYSESHEVPDNWCCSMLTLENGEKGNCADPEEDTDEQYFEYCPGTIVWAKLGGYPWWPCMVDEDPDVEDFSWREEGTLYYNVTFLDEKPTRAWVPEAFICSFLKPPRKEKKLKQNKYAKAISKAKERAEAAMKMTIKERLRTFSFVYLYKGRWPAASNYEECDHEGNGCSNIEDMAGIIMKENDELGSVCSTDTDDKRIKNNFSEQENKKTEKRKRILKNSSMPSLNKKAYKTKYLNNKDFVPETETMFPFMQKKNYKYSASINKTSSDVKHLAESITNPHQKKEAKGMKRKINRKFTPRKEKNFEKLSPSLIDDIIDLEITDSEHESDKNFKEVSVPKEESSKSFRVPEEGSMPKDNDDDLSKVTDFENTNSEHKTDKNLSKVNEKKMDDKSTHAPEESSLVGGKDKSLSDVPKYKKHKTEKPTNKVNPLDLESLEVLDFVENENLETFDECNSTGQKKIKTSNELKKNVKQRKSQNSLENVVQSNSKIPNLKENINKNLKITSDTKGLQNVINSTSKTNKQIKPEAAKQTKTSERNIKLVNGKMHGHPPKQQNSAFSLPVKGSEQNDKVIVDKNTESENVDKENKILKPKHQNPVKDPNPSVKVNPIFKLPIKTDKKVSQNKIKNVKKLAGGGKLNSVDIKPNIPDECKENCDNNLVKKDTDKNNFVNEKTTENNPIKDPNPSVKVNTIFKLPIKTDKKVSQNKIKNVKKLAGGGKLNSVDIKPKIPDECKENYDNKLVKKDTDKNNFVNEKTTENSFCHFVIRQSVYRRSVFHRKSKKVVSVYEENVSEVISIQDEDSVPINDSMKSTENHDNFFHFSVSDEEMD